MKKISLFIILIITFIFGCKQTPESHVVFERTYSEKEVKEFNNLVDSFEEVLVANYGDSLSDYERTILFLDDLSKNKIEKGFFHHNKDAFDILTEKDGFNSGLIDEIWMKNINSDSISENIILMQKQNNTITQRAKVVDSYVPNMYGKYIKSLKKVSSNDKLVSDYLSAKLVAINLSNEQLGEGLKYSIEDGGGDIYFLKRILVAEVYIPLIINADGF